MKDKLKSFEEMKEEYTSCNHGTEGRCGRYLVHADLCNNYPDLCMIKRSLDIARKRLSKLEVG